MLVRFFKQESGKEPVRDWLKGLSVQERKIIGADVMTVQWGWPIGMPVVRSLESGLWEVRSDLPSGKIARVIFCVFDETIILLHGFIKKTQKTPKQDMEKAKKRRSLLMRGTNYG
jgi:phage-related protein